MAPEAHGAQVLPDPDPDPNPDLDLFVIVTDAEARTMSRIPNTDLFQ